MKDKSFEVGLIGLNHGVKLILPALIRSPRVDTISLAGSSSSIGKKISVQNHDFVAATAEELFNSKSINIIFICTPPATHLELVAKALQSRKFVYCEKPGGLDSDEVTEMNRISNESKIPVTIGFEYRFDPFIIFLKKNLEKVGTSKLRMVEVHWETGGALSNDRQAWKRRGTKGGEVIRDFLPHVIDYLTLCLPALFKQDNENLLNVLTTEIEYDQIQLHFQIRNVEFEISISRRSVSPIGHRIRILGEGVDIEVLRKQPYSLEAGHILINGRSINIRSSEEIVDEITSIESEITFRNSLQTYATDVLVEQFLLSCDDGDFSRVPGVHDALENMKMIDCIVDQSRSGVRK